MDARAAASAALRRVVHDAAGRRRPGSAAAAPSATPSASKARGSVRAKRGESERLIAGAATLLAEPPDERAAALGVGQPVEGRPSEQLEQRRRPRAARARPGTRRAASSAGSPRRAALAAARSASRRRVERRPRHAAARGVAAAAVRRAMQMTFMNASVIAVGQPRTPALEATARSSSPRGPDPVRLEAVPAARRRRRSPARAPPGRGSSPAVAASWPWCARRGAGAAGSPGRCRAAAAAAAASPSARARAVAQRRRRRCRWWRRRPDVAVAHHRHLDRHVVDRGGLCRPVGGEAQQQRALAGDRGERVAGRAAAASARSASSSGAQATPTSTSRKRAGAAPCETCIDLAGLALAAVDQRREPPSRRRADGVAARPRTRGVTPA